MVKLPWPWTSQGKSQAKQPEYSDPVAQAAVRNAHSQSEDTRQTFRKSHWLWRLLRISPFGILRLAFFSVIVGFFMILVDVQENPEEVVEATALTYVKHAAELGLQAAGWAAKNFWEPAMLGATIVIPLWLLWRLITLPFRR